MRKDAFEALLDSLGRLMPKQRQAACERIQTPETGKEAGRETEGVLPGIPLCPSCGSGLCCRWGHMSGLQRFRCKNCRRSFNRLSGTPLAHLHHKDCWLAYSECMEQSLTLRTSAKLIGVNKNTTFRWRHRFLDGISEDQAQDLAGIVEMDETIFPESFKGKRKLPRSARKRKTPTAQRGGFPRNGSTP